jgi:GGDEF domain-containing protein
MDATHRARAHRGCPRSDTDLVDATVTADRRRSAVAASPLAVMCAGVLDDPDLDPDTFRLTVSVGVAVYPSDGQPVDDLLFRADRAMYAAEAVGRDRVRLAADVTTTLPSPAERGRTDLQDTNLQRR